MIPRLHRSDATKFDTLGYGALTHTISCTVTEELGVAPTLELSVLMDDPIFVNVEVGNIITTIPNKRDNIQAFIIEEISKPIDGVVTIYATHIAQHRGKLIPVAPFTAANLDEALSKMVSESMESNPFTLVRDSGKNNVVATMSQTVPHSFRELMGGVEGSVLDTYRGEWAYDNFVCTLYNKRGRDNGAKVMYGRNMSDFNLDELFNWDNSVTGVIGYWVNSEDGTTVIGDIQYSEYADLYPYNKTVCMDFSDKWETAPSKADLNTYALTWINGKGLIGASVDVAYQHVNVEGGADVGIGDIVHIFNGAYNFEMESRIVGLEFDVLSEEYTNVTIGDMKTTLNEAISEIGGGSTTVGGGGASVEPSTTTPLMDGTAQVGTEQKYARGDHVHPSDTSRVATSGDTMTGDLSIKSSNIDMSASTPSSNQYGNSNFTVNDTNGTRMGYIRPVRYTSGTAGTQFFAVRGSVHNGIILTVDENDNRAVTVSDAAAWRSALACAPLSSPAFTGNPTAPTQAAGNNSTRLSTTAFVYNEVNGKRILGHQLINVSTTSSIAVGSTGTATGTITAVTGATDYIVLPSWANYCTINNVTRSNLTLTVTLRNVSNAAHTLAASVRVLAIG